MTVRRAAGAIVLWMAIVAAFAHGRPPWGDEEHYLQTVRLFAERTDVERLRTYPEMTAPLAFMAYAAWGQVAGLETDRLRLLSSLLGIGTLLLLTAVLARTGPDTGAIALALGVVAANPYFVGLAAFVFTDMLALLLMMGAWVALERRQAALLALALAGAMLTRQYFAFLVPAVLATAIMATDLSARARVTLVVAALVSLVPIAGLAWFWGGLSPVNSLRGDYLTDGLRYNPRALSLYLAAPGLYLAPLLALLVMRARLGRRAWAAGAAAALLVVLVPVEAADVQRAEGSVTVGLLDRALAQLPWAMAAAVWSAGALVWVASATSAAGAAVRERTAAAVFPVAALVAFLGVMPFSYMPWEKYALPAVMLGAVLAARACQASRAPHRAAPAS